MRIAQWLLWNRAAIHGTALHRTAIHGVILSLTGVAVFIGMWESLARSGYIAQTLLPPPSLIPAAAWREWSGGYWWKAVSGSCGHYAAGVLLGSIAGVTLGALAGLSRAFEASQRGIVRLLRPIRALPGFPLQSSGSG